MQNPFVPQNRYGFLLWITSAGFSGILILAMIG